MGWQALADRPGIPFRREVNNRFRGVSRMACMDILEEIGLADYFDAISDGTNISRSKPDTEVFLKAVDLIIGDGPVVIRCAERQGFFFLVEGEAFAAVIDTGITGGAQIISDPHSLSYVRDVGI